MKHKTTSIAVQAMMTSKAARTPQKILSSDLYRQIVIPAAALRGKIYAHHEMANFVVQKVGKRRNIKRYKNRSTAMKPCARRGHSISFGMLSKPSVRPASFAFSASSRTTTESAACAGGAMKRNMVGCGRSHFLSRARETC